MAEHDGKPDIEDIITPSEAEGLIAWTKAALIRAVKTAAQSAVAAVGTAAAIGSVDWRLVAGTAALAAVLSLLTSVAGVPAMPDIRQQQKRPSAPMHGAEGRFCMSASEAGLELVDRHLERVRHSSGRAECHEPRVAHAPDPLVDPLSGKSGGARDLRLPHPPFIQHIRERHPFRLPARYPSVPAHSASTPAGIECPDSPAANAPSAMTSEHNPSLSFMMSHAIGWEPGLPDSWDIRKALSSPPVSPPWRLARFGLPVEGDHHRGYGRYDRPEPGEKFARRLQQLRDLLHVHLLSLPTPQL